MYNKQTSAGSKLYCVGNSWKMLRRLCLTQVSYELQWLPTRARIKDTTVFKYTPSYKQQVSYLRIRISRLFRIYDIMLRTLSVCEARMLIYHPILPIS